MEKTTVLFCAPPWRSHITIFLHNARHIFLLPTYHSRCKPCCVVCQLRQVASVYKRLFSRHIVAPMGSITVDLVISWPTPLSRSHTNHRAPALNYRDTVTNRSPALSPGVFSTKPNNRYTISWTRRRSLSSCSPPILRSR